MSEPRIKAIETSYKGYRFRSRLEARWAVFLDELGLPWQYEREGYDLDGLRYLPDFWLPRQRQWMEVKPDITSVTDEEREKCRRLAVATGFEVGMVFGDLCAVGVIADRVIVGACIGWYPNPISAYLGEDRESIYGETMWEWGACDACGALGMGHLGTHRTCHCSWQCKGNRPACIIDAYAAARSARFEFGESGSPQ